MKFLEENAKTEELSGDEKEKLQESEKFIQKFKDAMEDDFNTADAISAVFELVKYINQNTNEDSSKEYVEGLYDVLEQLCDVLGIIVAPKEEILDAEIEEMIRTCNKLIILRDGQVVGEITENLTQENVMSGIAGGGEND